ncbi:MAG TPA: ATP-binding protein [Candidatus Baltobacteraceae bacterium]|nr:ATP-binding protein [Candidatus Baltobacteraceae bacterium]
MSTRLGTIAINRPEDVFALRQSGRAACAVLGHDEADQVRFATALSELGRETLVHKTGATARFVNYSDTDIGIEIERFPRAGLAKGGGFDAASRLVDDIRVTDETPETVTVMLRRAASPRTGRVDAAALREAVAPSAPFEPLENLRIENGDLIRTLNELRERRDQLVQLNAELEETNRGVMAMYNQLAGELEETNRGVVALYAELDDKSARLNEANQAKSRFLASVSHELRSPVNSTLGLLRIMLDPQSDPLTVEQRKQLSLMSKSANELLQLVNALLDLARAESGRLQPEISEIQIDEVFSELRGSLKPLAREGVDLTFSAPEGISIQSDRLLFTQVIRNLVTNALKFTQEGYVAVRVQFPTPYEIEISVEDTGIGIAPENQEKVFEEFFQVRGPLQADHKGSGLGLPYAKRVVQALGGTLSLASVPGQGSTFSVLLPLQWQALLSARETPPTGTVQDVEIETALIIDDDAGFRAALRGMLQGIAARIFEATCGREGLEMMRRHSPDIAFIDLRMPDIDGADVLAEMNADPDLRRIPGVIVTSTEIDLGNLGTLGLASALLGKSQVNKDKLRTAVINAFKKTETAQ